MSENAFPLDAIRADLEAKYDPVTVTLSDGSSVILRGMLRINRDKRKRVKVLLEDLDKLQNADDAESLESLETLDKIQDVIDEILTCVADRYTDLLRELDGDLELSMLVLNKWMGGTQSGEASSSPSSSTSTDSGSSQTSESGTESAQPTSSAPALFIAPATS